jgi:hypothetical protein
MATIIALTRDCKSSLSTNYFLTGKDTECNTWVCNDKDSQDLGELDWSLFDLDNDALFLCKMGHSKLFFHCNKTAYLMIAISSKYIGPNVGTITFVL